MDLEPIEERANEFATWVGKFDSVNRIPAAFASAADVPALIAEVKRLRADAWARTHPKASLVPLGNDTYRVVGAMRRSAVTGRYLTSADKGE